MKMLKLSKMNCLVLIVAMSLVAVFSFAPKKTYAIGEIVEDPLNLAENTWTAFLANEAFWKDYVLDPLAYSVAQQLLNDITESTVAWINSGFEGGPLYDVNFADSIKNGLDEASGILIDKLGATEICENLAPSLNATFEYEKPFELRMKCTLSDAIENVEDFYNDFAAGGWKGWLSLTTQPQNNPYGAYIETAAEYEKMRAEKAQEVQTEISSGGGFKSFKKCDTYTKDSTGADTKTCAHWTIQTPGKTIEARMTAATGVDFASLQVADEMDEILSALLQQTMKSLFEEGSSSSSSGDEGGGGLANAVIEDLVPATIAEEMSSLRDSLGMYYDYFTNTSDSMPYGAHYAVLGEVWARYSMEETYWRLAQYCVNDCSTEVKTTEGLELIGEITSAALDEQKSEDAFGNSFTDIANAESLYSEVYDPFYVIAGWTNVVSEVLTDWQSRLSSLESIQYSDNSSLKMSKMAYDSAKDSYEDKCESHILSYTIPSCNVTAECATGLSGQKCERGETCNGGTMRPAADASFCCVDGGVCISATGGYVTIATRQPSEVKCDEANNNFLIDEPDKTSTGATITKNSCGGTSSISGPGWEMASGCSSAPNDYMFVRSSANSGTTAKWTPNIKKTGRYEVWVSWFATPTNSAATSYSLHTMGKDYSFLINQKGAELACSDPEAIRWANLGTFDFEVGTNGYVKMSNTSGNDSEAIGEASFIFRGDIETPSEFIFTPPPEEGGGGGTGGGTGGGGSSGGGELGDPCDPNFVPGSGSDLWCRAMNNSGYCDPITKTCTCWPEGSYPDGGPCCEGLVLEFSSSANKFTCAK